MPGMFRFVLKFSGRNLMEETLARIKVMAAPSRQLGLDMYEVLSQDPKPSSGDQFIHFRHSTLLAAYTGPEKLLTPADVRKMHNKDNKDQISAANRLIREIQKLVQKLSDPTGCAPRATSRR